MTNPKNNTINKTAVNSSAGRVINPANNNTPINNSTGPNARKNTSTIGIGKNVSANLSFTASGTPPLIFDSPAKKNNTPKNIRNKNVMICST